MSRRKTQRREDERNAEDEDVELDEQSGISSQSSCGVIPLSPMNPATTTALTAKVIAAVTVADAGTIARGKASRRTSEAFATIDVIPSDDASSKNVKSTIPISSPTA